jgi:hypothetical protein
MNNEDSPAIVNFDIIGSFLSFNLVKRITHHPIGLWHNDRG